MSRILIAVALLPLLAGAASAAERDVQTASVSLRGINVGSAAGAALLHARIVAAARQVCGTADTKDMQAMADMNACRAAALAQAAPQLEVALVSARLAARDSVMAAR
jgi:UrcA family protein